MKDRTNPAPRGAFVTCLRQCTCAKKVAVEPDANTRYKLLGIGADGRVLQKRAHTTQKRAVLSYLQPTSLYKSGLRQYLWTDGALVRAFRFLLAKLFLVVLVPLLPLAAVDLSVVPVPEPLKGRGQSTKHVKRH